MFGADRFYLGYILQGALKLCTFGGVLVWNVLDAIRIGRGREKDDGGNTLVEPEPVGEPKKSRTRALLFSMFLGMTGADRFYLGYRGPAAAKLVTCGGQLVWGMIDLIKIGLWNMRDFYGDHKVLAVVKLLMWGGATVWWLVDLIRIGTGTMLDAEGNSLLKD
jgi:TM2 domain-containing membrane protein YozV